MKAYFFTPESEKVLRGSFINFREKIVHFIISYVNMDRIVLQYVNMDRIVVVYA